MFDIEIHAPEGARSLYEIGRALGAAGVGMEGGGLWADVAHYLVADPNPAVRALADAGFGNVEVREVVLADLDADVPGALGRMMNKLMDAGVTLYVQYSDHDNHKVLIVDDVEAARAVLNGR